MPASSLDKEKMEALELFENHVQVKEIKAGCQMEYVNNPTKRRVIWTVGEKGNEGKTFFQEQVEVRYGMHRVCAMSLTESSKNRFLLKDTCKFL